MSIIRSNIARQLLAEGGAPRKRFYSGGFGDDQEDDVAAMEASMGISGGPSSSEYSGMDNEEQQAIDQARFNAGFRSPDYISMGVSDNAADRGFFRTAFNNLGAGLQNRRGQNIFNFLGRSTAPTLRGKLGFGKPGDINYVLDVLNNPDDRVYGLSNKEREIGEKLIDAGIKDEFDIRNMTQSKFDELFPGPNKGEGGDNEPIRKLKAPITEKKEEPKDEFDDILKFYGARFARGGRTDAESQYGADSAGSYSYADDGNRDDGGGPPTVMGGGNQPPSQKDLQGLRNQGFSDSKIAEMLGPLAAQYGLQQEQPEVLGVLGEAGPSIEFGQQVTKGPGAQPTELETRQKDIEEIGKSISDPGSLFGQALTGITTNRDALKEAIKEYGGPRFEDGGVIRQNYGLGSIVKKIGRTVKKIAKSPIGKAALIGGLGYLGATKTGFGSGLLESFKAMSPIKKALLIGGTAATLSPFAMKDEEEEELPAVSNTDPEFQKYLAFYGGPRRFAEGGGDIDEAPMESMPRQEMASKPSSFAELNMLSLDLFGRPYDQLNDSEQEILMEYFSKSKGMPERTMAAGGGMMNPNDEMLNLGGNEMDLRGGGFVPLGEYEKKDDVPARLSKNEFVFTADAVRAAGGGSVDRGADLMYKTMKQLENKVV